MAAPQYIAYRPRWRRTIGANRRQRWNPCGSIRSGCGIPSWKWPASGPPLPAAAIGSPSPMRTRRRGNVRHFEVKIRRNRDTSVSAATSWKVRNTGEVRNRSRTHLCPGSTSVYLRNTTSFPTSGTSTFRGNPSFRTSAANCSGVPIPGKAPFTRKCWGMTVFRLGLSVISNFAA